MLVLYGHCPNSFRPLCQRGKRGKKSAPNHPGKPLHPPSPLRAVPIWKQNISKKGFPYQPRFTTSKNPGATAFFGRSSGPLDTSACTSHHLIFHGSDTKPFDFVCNSSSLSPTGSSSFWAARLCLSEQSSQQPRWLVSFPSLELKSDDLSKVLLGQSKAEGTIRRHFFFFLCQNDYQERKKGSYLNHIILFCIIKHYQSHNGPKQWLLSTQSTFK